MVFTIVNYKVGLTMLFHKLLFKAMDRFETVTTKIEAGDYKVERDDGETFRVKKKMDNWVVFHDGVAASLTRAETKATCILDIELGYLNWS
jgi:hypothetical protein